MRIHHKRRLLFIIVLVLGVSISVGLALLALRENINLYYTPSDIFTQHISRERVFRLGGVVLKGSVHYQSKNAIVSFVMTDFHHKLEVVYYGALPSLFREGQGIIAQGQLNAKGVFMASQVLAKHDANYHPPKIMSEKEFL